MTLAPRSRTIRWIYGLFALLGVSLLLLLLPPTEDATYWPIIGVATAVTSLALLMVLSRMGFAWQSAPVAYLGFAWLFHFPMTLLVYLIPDLWGRLPRALYGWTQRSTWYDASIYALACLAAFAVGSGLAAVRQGKSAVYRPLSFSRSRAGFQVGMITAIGGLCWLVFILAREGGLQVFETGYIQLYDTVFSSSFSLAVFFITIGSLIALLGAPAKLVWMPLALQASASAVVLLTGARQFALIGPLAVVAVMAKRGLRLNKLLMALACVAALFVIAYVGAARRQGILENSVELGTVEPVNAMVEMGASLETTSLAFDWIRNGDQFLTGGSYWLPFERAIGVLIPSMRVDLATDPRAMNMVLESRTSGLGGSSVAESYYNFGISGAFVFLVLGYVLASMEIRARSPHAIAWLGVILYAVLFQARNWFISVPMLLLLGALPILLCIWLETAATRKADWDLAPAPVR